MKLKPGLFITFVALSGLCVACGADPLEVDREQEWVDEYGVLGPFESAVEAGKEDSAGTLGPRVAWDRQNNRVWEVTRSWADISPEAGIAWEANSGLDWNEKYAAWLESLTPIDYSYSRTFEFVNPQGVAYPAPVLECAEVAIFLRVAFASWYGLPFYMEARHNGQPIYLGHFGFLKADGTRFGSSPAFNTRYSDYSATWRVGEPWPVDQALQRRSLYGGGDEVPFLPEVDGSPAGAGAYFDAVFLNKRVGHFMLIALSWFGSINLADGSNMFHIQPEATRAGDIVLHRWQRTGIGHVIPVMGVHQLGNGRFEVDVAQGSMPRRIPTWDSGSRSVQYFTSRYAGGEGENSDGIRYAALGGGLRRWRVALSNGTRYRNTFLEVDRPQWIMARNYETIASRPERFRVLLTEMTHQEERDLILERIESYRAHLRNHPASCMARARREEAFQDLYNLHSAKLEIDRETTDNLYRTLEDYVFAELEYSRSKTCCWNSTTPAMYEIVMDLAHSLVEDDHEECIEPFVFMARNDGTDGFELFRQHAQELGRPAEWVAWSRDESCPQANVAEDTLVETAVTPFCELEHGDNCRGGGPTREEPLWLDSRGRYEGNHLCEGERHFWGFVGSGQVSFTIEFSHAEGDLDLTLTTIEGLRLDTSNGTGDSETVSVRLDADQAVILEVYGYQGASAAYDLLVE